MNDTGALNQTFRRVQMIALAAGIVAAVLCVVGAVLDLHQFMQSYLFAYMFCLTIALGSLGILLLDYLAGGTWGIPIQRPLEAAARTLPLLAVLFIPILVGLRELYPWARPEAAADPLLQQKAAYLNVPFFIARAVVYFALWIGLAYVLNRWAMRLDERPDPDVAHRHRLWSALGLGVVGLTSTFAFIDWLMSLEPDWASTIFGFMVGVGALLGGLALVVLLISLLVGKRPTADVVTPRVLNDLGGLLLAFVMIWAYMAFSQYLIIWLGNLREEIPWYMKRILNGWQWIALLIIVLHFALPFLMLLSRSIKRSARALLVISALILAMRLVDMFWIVAPAFRPGLSLSWTDLVAPIALIGIWLGAFLWLLRQRALVPRYDRNWREIGQAEAQAAPGR